MSGKKPSTSQRIISRDGNFNVKRLGLKSSPWTSDLYHSLLTISWPRFLLLVVASYILVNLIFGLGYFLCGPNALDGIGTMSTTARFWESFFFSVQTLATIGYGRMSPIGLIPNLLMTLEALVGLLSLALVTGIIFSRFSRPTARVSFSSVAVITAYRGQPALMFRMANERFNQIVQAGIEVVMIQDVTTPEGQWYRILKNLELERNHTPIFALTWTIIHRITESSPLFGLKPEDITGMNFEILASLSGMDETFSQTIHARTSYRPHDIRWNKNFRDMISFSEEGQTIVNLNHISSLEEI